MWALGAAAFAGTLSTHDPVPGLLHIEPYSSAAEVVSSHRLATVADDQALVFAASAWVDWRYWGHHPLDTDLAPGWRALSATDFAGLYGEGPIDLRQNLWLANHYRVELRDYWHAGAFCSYMGRRQVHTNAVLFSIGPMADLAHALPAEGDRLERILELHAGAVGSVQWGAFVATVMWHPLRFAGDEGAGISSGVFGLSGQIDPRDRYRKVRLGEPKRWVAALNPEFHFYQYPLADGLWVRELTWRVLKASVQL